MRKRLALLHELVPAATIMAHLINPANPAFTKARLKELDYGARARHPSQRHRVIVERYGMQRPVEAIGKVEYPSIDLKVVQWQPAG